MLFRRTERTDDEIVRALLDSGGELGIVAADLARDAVEGQGEPSVVLVDAGQLPTDLFPGDSGESPG